MALAERSAAEAAQRIAGALEAAGTPYAIGGALALAIAGVPRGTADVDVNVFVPLEQTGFVAETLQRSTLRAKPSTQPPPPHAAPTAGATCADRHLVVPSCRRPLSPS